MGTAIGQIFFYILNIIIGYLIFLIVGKFLTLRKEHPLLKIITVNVLLLSSIIKVYPEETTGTSITFILLFLVVLIMYKNNLIIKVSTVIILAPIMIAISFLTDDFGFFIWYYVFQRELSDAQQLILELFTVFLRIPIWYCIYCFARKWITEISKELTKRMWLVIDAISITSCIGIITIIYNIEIITSYVAYPACIACIFTCLGIWYLCGYISKTLKADMEIQTLKYQQSYYAELEENQHHLRKLRHDMKNHLNVIGTFLRDEDIEHAKEYFSSFSDEFDTNTRVFCQNSLVNAVLNTKYNLAVQNKIACSLKIDIDQTLPIDDISLCSLMSNTLDNAIEACQKIDDPDRRQITLKSRCFNLFFSYEISNSKANEIRIKNNRYITEKADKESHGFGLRNVKEMVEKYNGNIDITHTDNTFTITVLIGME